jgi:RNA-binding protein
MKIKEICDLRAKAHALKPVVIIGNKGLTENVHLEIEAALLAHELIKIRIPRQEDKTAKSALIDEICGQHHAQLIQTMGHIVTIYRKRPDICL